MAAAVLKAVGLGESRIGEPIADSMETGRKPTVGTLAHAGQMDVRIAAKGATPEEAEIRSGLGDARFGAGVISRRSRPRVESGA